MSLQSLHALDSVIDSQELLTRCLNNLDFAERMLNLFEGRCCEELTDLDAAFEKGDLNAVRLIAHRLAGACANAAAFGLQTSATELRHAATDGSIEKASRCLHDLRQEWHRFMEARSADPVL